MFRRKDEDITQDLLSEAGGSNVQENTATETNTTTEDATPAPAATPAATPATNTAGYTRPAATPAGRPTSFRPAADFNRSRGAANTSATEADSGSKSGSRRVLTVGNDILLKGEIATCDRLVIEGAVDATLNEVHTVEIAENGSFKGIAEIEDAEISGLFEGELIVRNRLIIYSTGQVRGKITYGEIEIERGGEMTGEIKSFSSAQDSKSSKAKKAA